MTKYRPRYYQQEAIDIILNLFEKKKIEPSLIVHPTGCHAINYEIKMADQTVKMVENIKKGEQVMGPDFNPRTVLEVKRGQAMMYKISLQEGEEFVVNGGHLLALYRDGTPSKEYPTLEIVSVLEYLEWPLFKKYIYKIKKVLESGGERYAFTVTEDKFDDYYGFELDGDHLYLDKQNNVHHNSGKSIIIGNVASHLAKELQEPILVLQPSKELLSQNYAKMQSYGGTATIYSASLGVKEISMTTFATLGSIKKIAAEFKKLGVRKVLIDEAHFKFPPDSSSMFRKFIKELAPTHVIGLTASPIRLKAYGDFNGSWSQLNMLNRERPRFFKKIVHVVQIQEMVKKKFWAKINYELWDFDESKLRMNSTGADFSEKSISKALADQNVNNNIFKRIQELHAEGKSALVFLDSVANCEKMAKELSYVECITSNTSQEDRDEIIEKFKAGIIRFIVNFGTLTVGFDYPELETVILGRPSNSLAVIYQMLGRVVRNPKYPNQKLATVIDYCNNVKRFGPIEDLEVKNIKDYGWAMVSNGRILTGVPMDTTVLASDVVKAAEMKALKKKQMLQEYVMEFGKFEGKKLSEVPVSYRKWMVSNLDDLNKSVKIISKEELKTQLLALGEDVAKAPVNKDVSILIDLNNIAFSLNSRRKLSAEGLQSYIDNLRPLLENGEVTVISDGKKSEYWRKKIYPNYKDNRMYKSLPNSFVEGMAEIHEETDIVKENHLEADDIIAEKVRKFKGKTVDVVSNDGDFKMLNVYSRFKQFNPLTRKLMEIGKKEAIGVLLTKILKGDAKDNIKKSHKGRQVRTVKLNKAIDDCYNAILFDVKMRQLTDLQEVNLENIIYNCLEEHFDMDLAKYERNFKLLNLVQKVDFNLELS